MYTLKLTILSLLLAACTGLKTESSATNTIQLRDLQGNSIELTDYRGKTLFINIWATWCKPCIEEMPSIAAARTILQGKDIEFFLATDESKERIESFEAQRQLGLPYVELENMEALQIFALPHTYIINSKGEVVFSEAGYRKWDDPENIELLNTIISEGE